MRTVSYRLADVAKVTIALGHVAENDATRVQIDAGQIFAEYPDAVPSLTLTNPDSVSYPAVVVKDGNNVIWDVKDSDLAVPGTGEFQLTFTDNGTVVKSCIGKTKICRSIVGEGQAPDPVQDWIDRAEEVLEEVETAFPEGGTTGQVLAKKSDADFDTEWVDQGAGGVSDYDDLENRPQIGGVTLTGDKSLHDLGAAAESDIPDVSGFYTKPAGGIPASDIAAGVIPDPAALIDDTSTAANKVWSANKSNELKSAINSKFDSLPTEETGQDLLEKEFYNTGLTDTALMVLGMLFDNMPQDETATDILHSLDLECVRLNAIYELWLAEKESA